MSTEINYRKEVELIKSVVEAASEKFIVPKFQNLDKSDVTREGRYDKAQLTVDVNASKHILDWCRKRHPGSFTEEEISDERFEYDISWIIDPLDGTDEFKNGFNGFVVQGSLVVRRGKIYVPVAGFIYLPLEKKFLYATEKDGPFLESPLTQITPHARSNIIIGTQRKMDVSKELNDFYEFLREKGEQVQVLETGGAGSTIAQMVIGSKRPNLYIMPRPYTKEWDLSPSEPIVNRMGGWITDLYGNTYTYNRKDFRNPNGYVVSLGPEKHTVIRWIEEFGIENLLKAK